MTFNGLFPIGTVVMLKESTKRVMITGVCQYLIEGGEHKKFYDYVGVVFPEGYLSADQNFLFNQDQIASVYFIGLQDEESLIFKQKADQAAEDVRAGLA